MRAVLQRVKSASVTVDGEVVGVIGQGLLVLLGVAKTDTAADRDWLLSKMIHLRIFPNAEGKFHHSLLDVRGAVLLVSQFTLFADCRKGRRPGFEQAADPELGNDLYLQCIAWLRAKGIQTETGRFGAIMDVALVNDGPVTILLDSTDRG
ncbi:MAG: D-aminoacyl-tRNA deacylase [bacterium]|jgi:D-tyrosyl-tRNA(Tyr) deacylase|nr:D-aminoacyl-tRNA deacylase [bacterium]